jgi:hypothetical protein
MNMIRQISLLLLAAVLLVSDARGQLTTIEVGSFFGITSADGKKFVRDWAPVAGDVSKAKAKFPAAWAVMQAKHGFTDAQLMMMSVPTMVQTQAVWQGHGGSWTQPCMSRTNVDWSKVSGDWWMTFPGPICMGTYTGAGPHQGYNPSQATTTWHVWKDAWQGDMNEMNALQSTSWGIEGNAGWVHGFTISKMGFVGNRTGGWHDPTYTESGLAIWDPAEASTVEQVWSSNFNGYGLKLVRGTPFTGESVFSVFENTLGGVGMLDGSLGTFNLGTVSGDDNSALLVQDSKYGRPAGGMVDVDLEKSETGHRLPTGIGQIILWQKSPCNGAVHIGMAQLAGEGRFQDAAFVMNSGGGGQTLSVDGFVGWNFRTIVHDVTNKKRWPGTAYQPEVFVWASRKGGLFSDLVELRQISGEPVNATDRLGTVENNGTFNYPAGTPGYSITGNTTPPPVCTSWATSGWGACVNGTQSQTVTAAPSGCTGTPPGTKPSTTQVCQVVPPPAPIDRSIWTLTASATGSGMSVRNCIDATPGTRWSPGTALANGQWLRVDMGKTVQFKGVVMDHKPADWDHLRAYDLEIATNTACTNWTLAKQGVGTWGATNITIPPTSCRCYRITSREAVGNVWWSIYDLRPVE